MSHGIPNLIFCALIVSACALPPDASQSRYLTPSILNTNPEKYDGREVLVRGYVVLGTNGRSLYESKALKEQFNREWDRNDDDFDPRDYQKYCLTLLNARFLLDNREVFNGKTITIKGTFVMNYRTERIIDLQACALPGALALDDKDIQRVYQSLIR